MPKKHYKNGENSAKKLGPVFNLYLGPVFNSTAYIYIYRVPDSPEMGSHKFLGGPVSVSKCNFERWIFSFLQGGKDFETGFFRIPCLKQPRSQVPRWSDYVV